MKVDTSGDTVKLWLSEEDTYQWANRPGAAWPCSFLSGKTLFAEFFQGDLVDVAVDGSSNIEEFIGDEFDAITSDFLESVTS
jgi:hypothetical protein